MSDNRYRIEYHTTITGQTLAELYAKVKTIVDDFGAHETDLDIIDGAAEAFKASLTVRRFSLPEGT